MQITKEGIHASLTVAFIRTQENHEFIGSEVRTNIVTKNRFLNNFGNIDNRTVAFVMPVNIVYIGKMIEI